jgi:hypothetical protein
MLLFINFYIFYCLFVNLSILLLPFSGWVIFFIIVHCQCPGGGIGRRAGLKHLCLHGHAGSTPALGTKNP